MQFDETSGSQSQSGNDNDNVLAGLIYVIAFAFPIIGPLILWLVKKDEARIVDHHGREYFNMLITHFLVGICIGVVGFVLTIIFPPFFILMALALGALGLAGLVLQIIAAIKAFDGNFYRIPFCLRIL